MPVPMIAPTPRLVSPTGPSTLLRRFSPFISSRSMLRGFLSVSWLISGEASGCRMMGFREFGGSMGQVYKPHSFGDRPSA